MILNSLQVRKTTNMSMSTHTAADIRGRGKTRTYVRKMSRDAEKRVACAP
jgi:hypothetical protein